MNKRWPGWRNGRFDPPSEEQEARESDQAAFDAHVDAALATAPEGERK